MTIDEKYEQLKKILRDMGRVLVAFSGGVDSTFLLRVAHDELGDHALAITIDAPFHSRHEIDDAARLATALGVRHIRLDLHDMDLGGLADNPPDRCYVCKKAVFGLCAEVALKEGEAVLLDGSNVDDLGDYRPGRKALEELAVRSPLLESGLGKAEIRELSHRVGLDTWDKPALACLLTRFPHGAAITAAGLAMVEACEEYLRSRGFGQFRVRAHGDTARIELDDEGISNILESGLRRDVCERFHQAGFRYVALDLDGYRCGAMNPEQ